MNGSTLDIGSGYELYVIAAAVVGGTSFAGGIGTIPGAVLGAFVLQSLAYGLSFLGVNSPGQNVVAGVVLIVAVGLDTLNRRRSVVSDVEDKPVTVAATNAHRRDARHQRRVRRRPCRAGRQHRLYAGEVIGLVGGNGAGKSTLMRVLSGAHPADSGEILVDGKPVSIKNPRDAKAQNIETIYQTLALADNIDAPGNLFLGRELTTRLGSLDDSSMESETRKIMGRLNPNFKNFVQPVKTLSGGQRQAVAIARAVYFNAKILIMDEPTAALGPAETAQVRNLVRQLKEDGIGIFLISHDIHDVFDLSDRISVMYHGRIVDTVNKAEVDADAVLGMIILGKRAGRGQRDRARGARAARLTRLIAPRARRGRAVRPALDVALALGYARAAGRSAPAPDTAPDRRRGARHRPPRRVRARRPA